ncbi:MAG: FeoB-associated Cys-rich membrane protein [Lachnospiraceae bacterium]|nr:FeoB-associated Cys-rich membrane protein [Lachnospiraceae bacterium]
MGTIAVSMVLLLIVGGILLSFKRDREKGRSSCGCGCGHCSGCAGSDTKSR